MVSVLNATVVLDEHNYHMAMAREKRLHAIIIQPRSNPTPWQWLTTLGTGTLDIPRPLLSALLLLLSSGGECHDCA